MAGGLLGLLRMCQRHPERITEASVDQLAEAELRLLGVPAGEPPASPPSRSLPLTPGNSCDAPGNSRDDAAGRIPSATPGGRGAGR